MDLEYWTKAEQEQYSQRMEDEHHRQNKRIETLESNYERLTELTMCVQKQTLLLDNMSKEIKSQGEKINSIINVPNKQWQRVKDKSLDTAVGIIAGAIVVAIFAIIYQYM